MGLLARLIGRKEEAARPPDRETLDAWVRDAYDLQMKGDGAKAQALFHKVLEHDPRDVDALYFLGSLAADEKRELEAVDYFQKAVEARPGDALIWFALAGTLYNLSRLQEAVDAFQAGVRRHPEDADMAASLWMAMMQCDREEEARVAVEAAKREGLESLQIYANLAKIYREQGRIDESVAEYQQLLQFVPGDSDNFSNLLFTLNYSHRYSAADLLAAHRSYAERFARPYVEPPANPAWPRRLRIGYVSGDFRAHVIAVFFEPILERHDRSRFEIFCYYNHRIEDQHTARLREKADHWRDCVHMSDAEFADCVRADGIDILVDLSGHTGYNRLPAFGMKPAPVQATYLGYPGTTGLPAMDYRITDARADPPGAADGDGSERLVRLPDCFHCYRPRDDAPEVVPPPVLAKGHITFGCFNNFPKLSPPFMEAAARVLAAVPGSRLWLKSKPLGIPYIADRVRATFRQLGIDPSRVELSGWKKTMEHHLAAYGEVDIALDSFPYNGTTTTCEALWMGVPVVCVQGDRHAARVGGSLLHAMGLEDLLAQDIDGYVRKCAELAGDLPRLQELRASLRERMRASPLTDEPRFTANLERSYTQMWEDKLRAEASARTAASEADVARVVGEAGAIWDRAFESGNPGAAIDWLNKAITARQDAAPLHYMLGCSLQAQGKVRDAIASFNRAAELDPRHAKTRNNLGCALEAAGELPAALKCYEDAIALDPSLAVAFYNQGNAHRQAGLPVLAIESMRKAIALESGHADWHANLAELLFDRMSLDEARAEYAKALAIEPLFARAHAGLGMTLQALGAGAEAEAALRKSVELDPKSPTLHSNLLLSLHYLRGEESEMLFAEHVAWARRHARVGWQSSLSEVELRRPRARLRVGYVSPDFRAHPVAQFIEPVLRAHDSARMEVFCYSNVSRPDEVTQRLRVLAPHWREIAGLSDQQVAERVRFDRIDILVDLAGHSAGGRPGLFARKPAPLQVTWLGYPDTTGLAAIDYRITDALADPPGQSERFHVEKLLRLDGGFNCYLPPQEAPDVRPARASRDALVFGSFNHLWKITPAVMACWARILAALPASRLALKAYGLASPGAKRELLGRFAALGIAAERLILLDPETSFRAHLDRYNEIDIALDVFPYNGTTTTCEALWMGVPVVSLAGATHVARVGLSVLSRAGLADLVAASDDEYVSKALDLARDPARLEGLRAGLRERIAASPLCDAASFTRTLEAAYVRIWRDYVDEEKGPLRLHVGGTQRRRGWKIYNIQPGEAVDYVGDCTDLGQFADGSVQEIYASHVLEHLGYNDELPKALAEFHRVLEPGGIARISVPDFEILCRLFLDPSIDRPTRKEVMRMAFGGQVDEHDFHRVGLTFEFLEDYLRAAGFAAVERSSDFGLFNDQTTTNVNGTQISLNVIARK